MKKDTRFISILVCFAGKNRRIELNPKKCVVNRATKSFTYKALYKADNDKSYIVNVSGNGLKADVIITNRSGKQTIAERHGVDVRFGRYLFE